MREYEYSRKVEHLYENLFVSAVVMFVIVLVCNTVFVPMFWEYNAAQVDRIYQTAKTRQNANIIVQIKQREINFYSGLLQNTPASDNQGGAEPAKVLLEIVGKNSAIELSVVLQNIRYVLQEIQGDANQSLGNKEILLKILALPANRENFQLIDKLLVYEPYLLPKLNNQDECLKIASAIQKDPAAQKLITPITKAEIASLKQKDSQEAKKQQAQINKLARTKKHVILFGELGAWILISLICFAAMSTQQNWYGWPQIHEMRWDKKKTYLYICIHFPAILVWGICKFVHWSITHLYKASKEMVHEKERRKKEQARLAQPTQAKDLFS